MTLIFPDRTVVHLSYPKGLGLASRGVQPTYSYSVKHLPRPNKPGSPFEVLFVHGDIPSGLLDPRPVATFPLRGTTEATLHQVVARGLRSGSNYALLFRTSQWDFVAMMPSRDVAHTVAKHLFPSVTTSGWPTLSATGPVRLSVGFGEPRGPQLEIGDQNPSFEMVTTGASREYIVTGIQRCSPDSRLISPPANNGELGRSGAFKCFQLGGGLDVVVSIYGPKHFLHAAFYGLRLSGD
ncbi:MAG: hypothetical protein M3P18_04835 [Actinomycetota bacterium]|nr:hypothetical protein [Actinomycetota bacterium]